MSGFRNLLEAGYETYSLVVWTSYKDTGQDPEIARTYINQVHGFLFLTEYFERPGKTFDSMKDFRMLNWNLSEQRLSCIGC